MADKKKTAAAGVVKKKAPVKKMLASREKAAIDAMLSLIKTNSDGEETDSTASLTSDDTLGSPKRDLPATVQLQTAGPPPQLSPMHDYPTAAV